MLVKNQIKLVRSLQQKKFRDQNSLFVVEGEKMIAELLKSNYRIETLFATENWALKNAPILSEKKVEPIVVKENELERLTGLKTSNEVLATVCYSEKKAAFVKGKGLTLALDKINDPGNLGTIIRLADWFGIEQIMCATDSVDYYNPKVVQSSMGSVFRVNVSYGDLTELLASAEKVYGAVMDGESLYETDLVDDAVILMGSESHGISSELEALITDKITIPQHGEAESLNVAIATGIICAEFRRG